MQLLFTSVFVVTFVSLASSKNDNDVVFSSKDVKVELGTENNDYFVKITCNNDIWTNFPAVGLNTSSVAVIIFENYSFPTTLNVQSIVDSMKIKVEKELTLRKVQSIPSRTNFKGISVSDLNLNVNLPFDLLYAVSNLRSLSLNARLVRIPDSFYSDWAQNISVIDMAYNKLRKIATNDFARVVNVENLSLYSNAIGEIEPKAFDNLIKLNFLDLSLNRLQTLPLGIFHRMTSLAKIKLDMNLFEELPQGLLENNKNLEEFAMDENWGNVISLPGGMFKNLIHLKAVSLKRGRWKSLPSDLFVGCSALLRVDLYENQLTSLPSGIFNDAENLRILDLGRNRLKYLPAGIFEGLGHLEHLFMGNNQLTSLESEVLEDLESLECLDVSHNSLTQINDQLIAYLKSAIYINLSNNQLTFETQGTTVSSEYQKVTSSLVKNLSGSFINISNKRNIQQCRLDPSIKLKKVMLGYNRIAQFNTKLINIMKYSVSIDLRYNRISNVNLFELSSEMVICNGTPTDVDRDYLKVYLGYNPFHCDCNILGFVNYLNDPRKRKPFDICATEFHTFGTGFKCASPPKLENREIGGLWTQELDCQSKTTLPEGYCAETCVCNRIPEKRVLYVDCSNKNLMRVPPLIDNTQNWFIELNMSSNNIQQLPSLSVSYMTNVISLDLSNNNISTVTLDLFFPNLQHLKLHGNRISRLDSNVLEYLGQNNILLDLTLHDNNWICDCEAHKLVTFVQKTRFNLHEMKCHKTNTKLSKMTVSELCEDVIAIIVIACLSIALFAIVIASSVVLYCKYQREIKVWLYSKQCCLWFVAEDELDKDKEYDAFISFSHKDEDFVEKEIVAKLEYGPRPYKLCLHYRDWLAGEWIPIQIRRSVAESRRTIVILTPNFRESVWGLLEFRTAHTQAVKEGRVRLIVIIYGDIGNIDDLDQEMQDYLRLNTYIKWGDPWFWKKLQYALPHAKLQLAKNKTRNVDSVKSHLIQFPLTNSCGSDVMGKPNVLHPGV